MTESPVARPKGKTNRLRHDSSLPVLRCGRERRIEVRVGWLVEAVAVVLPRADEVLVRHCVDQVATTYRLLQLLCNDVVHEPSVLISGTSHSYRVTHAFIEALLASKVVGPEPARCQLCQSTGLTSSRHVLGGLLCLACRREQTVGACGRCGLVRPLRSPDEHAVRICSPCTASTSRTCCRHCDKVLRRADEVAASMCRDCLAFPRSGWQTCAGCLREGPVMAMWLRGPMCPRCHRKHRRPCERCGRERVVKSRLGGEAVCVGCYGKPQTLCGQCHQPRARNAGVAEPTCPRCDSSAVAACPTCLGEAFTYGSQGSLDSRCQACRLRQWVIEQLDLNTAIHADRLTPFLDVLATVDPERVRQWLNRAHAKDALTRMANGSIPFSHEGLDEAAGDGARQPMSITHLRGLLVASGVLASRDEHVVAMERSIERQTGVLHPDDAKIVRAYAAWHVKAGVRKRIAAGRSSRSVCSAARANVGVAVILARTARDYGCGLDALPQYVVDQLLSEHPRYLANMGTFLRWASSRDLIPRVILPAQQVNTPTQFAADDVQWSVARTLLHDETIAAQDRLAGCLVVLYGQTLRSIVDLRCSDVETTSASGGEVVTIRLGSASVELAEPLAQVARQVAAGTADSVMTGGVARAFGQQQSWLFNGRGGSKPLGAAALSRRLRHLGIEARKSRNTALLALARDVPPSVMADLLGISGTSADRWRQVAGAAWAEYARETVRGQPPGDHQTRPITPTGRTS